MDIKKTKKRKKEKKKSTILFLGKEHKTISLVYTYCSPLSFPSSRQVRALCLRAYKANEGCHGTSYHLFF